MLGPVRAGGRAAVARSVAATGVLDPQVGVDARRTGVEPGRRPGGPARGVAPPRGVGAGVRAAAVPAGVDHGPGAAPEGALQLLAPGHAGRRPLEVRDVGRESAAVAPAAPPPRPAALGRAAERA